MGKMEEIIQHPPVAAEGTLPSYVMDMLERWSGEGRSVRLMRELLRASDPVSAEKFESAAIEAYKKMTGFEEGCVEDRVEELVGLDVVHGMWGCGSVSSVKAPVEESIERKVPSESIRKFRELAGLPVIEEAKK